jgi:hypothetical protein
LTGLRREEHNTRTEESFVLLRLKKRRRASAAAVWFGRTVLCKRRCGVVAADPCMEQRSHTCSAVPFQCIPIGDCPAKADDFAKTGLGRSRCKHNKCVLLSHRRWRAEAPKVPPGRGYDAPARRICCRDPRTGQPPRRQQRAGQRRKNCQQHQRPARARRCTSLAERCTCRRRCGRGSSSRGRPCAFSGRARVRRCAPRPAAPRP